MELVENSAICWKNALAIVKSFGNRFHPLNKKVIYITGSTGLIGSQVVRTLLYARDIYELDFKITLLVRDTGKASALFDGFEKVDYREWNSNETPSSYDDCDILIHCACPTSSRLFVDAPIETAYEIVSGTKSCLDTVKQCSAESLVIYLSSMEVYGNPATNPIKEENTCNLDSRNPRNCYPISKLLSENLVLSFGNKYGIRTVVLRLAQTFGAGVRANDGRVFAEFARDARFNKPIKLLTDGSKRNSYLSVDDAVSAIIFLMLNRHASGVYNVANPATYCSILDMANFVANNFGGDSTKIQFLVDENAKKIFREGMDINLDISRLTSLGWQPKDGLYEMYTDLLDSWTTIK